LERRKTGIAIAAEAPIAAVAKGERYSYTIVRPGVGWYLNFFKDINGRRYGVFDEGDLLRFTMLTRDGVSLRYERTLSEPCTSGT